MKQVFAVLAVLAIAFLIYVWLSPDESATPTTSSSTTAKLPTPIPPVVNLTPTSQYMARPGALRPGPTPLGLAPAPTPQQSAAAPGSHPTAQQVAPSAAEPRAAQIRQIILGCAARARWTIRSYEDLPGATVRVTGYAPNDNVANQRFIEEVKDSGILRDIDTGPGRRFVGPDQRPMLESTLIIKWR